MANKRPKPDGYPIKASDQFILSSPIRSVRLRVRAYFAFYLFVRWPQEREGASKRAGFGSISSTALVIEEPQGLIKQRCSRLWATTSNHQEKTL